MCVVMMGGVFDGGGCNYLYGHDGGSVLWQRLKLCVWSRWGVFDGGGCSYVYGHDGGSVLWRRL